MKNQAYKFGIGVFLLAMSAGFVRIYSQTSADNTSPKGAFQEGQEKLCTEQRISTARTYTFRQLPRIPKAYGPKPWYYGLKKWIPFLGGNPRDKYDAEDIRLLRLDYGLPVPLGESDRSNRFAFSRNKTSKRRSSRASKNGRNGSS